MAGLGISQTARRIFDVTRHLRVDEGLESADSLKRAAEQTARPAGALAWKSARYGDLPVIACLIGGTGTGKSTLFNSLLGRRLSTVGVKRPSTLAAVIAVNEERAELFDDCPLFREDLGMPGESAVSIVRVPARDLDDLALADTPDFDSIEIANRFIAETFFIISDVLVFVTSQEKYGDLVGRELVSAALDWGKETYFVLNKTVSDSVWNDFVESLTEMGADPNRVLRVERLDHGPELIEHLVDRDGFSRLIAATSSDHDSTELRRAELDGLRRGTLSALDKLTNELDEQYERIQRAIERIEEIKAEAAKELESRLNTAVSQNVEGHVRNRLQELLRKYDIFFRPRMMVRRAVGKAIDMVRSSLGRSKPAQEGIDPEASMRQSDLSKLKSAARLEPVEAAIARLNKSTAEYLAGDESRKDLRRIAGAEVPRWDKEDVRARFEEAFPDMETLLEKQFERFREGLTGKDEVKLYGAYSVWAGLLVTVEAAIGGFGLTDAVLSGVILPFIPKWLLGFKVDELLKDISNRVDAEYRRTLHDILDCQAELYAIRFRGLLPDEHVRRDLKLLRDDLAGANVSDTAEQTGQSSDSQPPYDRGTD